MSLHIILLIWVKFLCSITSSNLKTACFSCRSISAFSSSELKFYGIVFFLVFYSPAYCQTQNSVNKLPGTQLLDLKEPLDEFMVDGINRFTNRALIDSPKQRSTVWKHNYQSEAAYIKSVEANRARLQTIIGAIDERDNPKGFELLATTSQDAIVARSADLTVYAVRWPVLPGITAEGLLIQPRLQPKARVIAIPDADWTPEMYTGISGGLQPHNPIARQIAEHRVQVVVPTLISRSDEYSGSPLVAYTNQPHREFIYRQAFQMGRHIIGYEVQKIQSAVDQFIALNKQEQVDLPIGVVGVGEGGLIAFYSAAIDPRIDAVMVSGYFQAREAIWEEPIYRNLWSLLTEFGDAEIASLVAPRPLIVEACGVPEVEGPPTPRDGRRSGAAPGKIQTCSLLNVHSEFDRAQKYYDLLDVKDRVQLIVSTEGMGASGSIPALNAFHKYLGINDSQTTPSSKLHATEVQVDPLRRQKRQVEELVSFTQRLMALSPKVRDEFWAKADRSSADKWIESSKFYRDFLWTELIGKLPESTLPYNVRSRQIIDDPAFSGYEVIIDVYPDVVAGGILLLPKRMRHGEKRPVVVCQHGLEGQAISTIDPDSKDYHYYKSFASELARQGYITFSPQNPYRGGDRFREIQRKSNPLKLSLFSFIVRQHERILEWLRTLPNVDPERIAFYGLSYGGKTAVRVPPILDQQYCLSICSGDYNDWIQKMVSVDESFSYMFTGEYEMYDWNMGNLASYAELSSLMTPRPFMVERGHRDGVAPDEWVASEFAKLKRHYDELGIGDKCEIEYFNGPHTINGVGTFAFLQKHLGWPTAPDRNDADAKSRKSP